MLAVPAVAFADSDYLDQQSTSSNTTVGVTDGNFGQSWTPGYSGSLTRITVPVTCTFGGTAATLSIYPGELTYLDALPSPLYTQPVTLTAPDCSTSPWSPTTQNLVLSSPLALLAGTPYTFLLTGQGQTDSILSTANPYAGGEAYFAPASSGDDLPFATYMAPPTYTCGGSPTELYNNWNGGGVGGGGTPPRLSTFGPFCVDSLATYHVADSGPGTIGLQVVSGAGGSAGTTLGPWSIVDDGQATPGYDNWIATPPSSPQAVIDGTYDCVDSKPSTWAQDAQSGGEGFCKVEAHPATLASGPDIIPPDVRITSPAAGSMLSGTVTVSADAVDDAGVASVQFKFWDGSTYTDLGTDTSAPYSVSFDTRTVSDCAALACTVYATATDTSGHTTTVGNGVGVHNSILVDTTNDPGTSTQCSLRSAIATATTGTPVDGCTAGTKVVLPAGTYNLSLGQLLISGDVTISGAGARTTAINGAATGQRVLEISSGNVTIGGVTIEDGSTSSSSRNPEPNAGVGGGIWIDNPGALTLQDSTVTNNAAGTSGGGIDVNGELTVERSTIWGNSTGGIGGGVDDFGSSVTISNSTITDNSAVSDGGGVLLAGGSLLVNDTIAGNTFGGLAGTMPGTFAGGIKDYGGASISISNTIVSGNGNNQCSDALSTEGHNISSDASCGFVAGGDLENTDPQLGPLADNGGPTDTLALKWSSPAIDAGDNAQCPPIDQRGVARQGSCDIGAYEYVKPSDYDVATTADLLDAIASAEHNAIPATIHLAAGIYDFSAGGFAVGPASGGPITLDGAGAGQTVLDGGNHATNVVGVGGNDRTTIAHMTIQRGTIDGIDDNGQLTLADSVVQNNGAAGIETTNRGLDVSGSTISGNGAVGSPNANNGGIYVESSFAAVDSTIADNNGNGIYVDYADTGASLANVTIAGNQGNGLAGGDAISLTNTIVANNALGDCATAARPVSNGNNLGGDGSCPFTTTGDLTSVDPQLGPLQDNGGPTPTMALRNGSPAIDAGNDAQCPATDQRGVTRHGQCDIGAYEYVPPPETPTIDAGLSPSTFICLNGWIHTGTVKLTIGTASLAVATDQYGNACTSSLAGLQLKPGMTIHGDDGIATDDLTLAQISVDSIDTVKDVATGHAPPGAAVEVSVSQIDANGPPLHQYSTVTADPVTGSWSVGDGFDLQRGQSVDAVTRDSANNATHAQLQLREPTIYASVSNTWINLQNWTPGVPVNLTLTPHGTGAPLTFVLTPDASGSASLSSYQVGHALAPGDVIDATNGTDTKSLTVDAITVDSVDPVGGVVSGTAPAGETVNVGESDGPTWLGGVQVTSSGTWSATVPTHPLPANWHINATTKDADGDQTSADAQIPVVSATINTDFVNTYNWPNGIDLTASVNGGTPFHVTTGADGSNPGTAQLSNGPAAALPPGSTIDVTGQAWGLTITKHLVVAGVTIDSVDPATGVASGTAPANATVELAGDIANGGNHLGQTTTQADMTGHWSTTLPFALTGAWTLNANVADADGDQSQWHAELPSIGASLKDGDISGFGWDPGEVVNLNINGTPMTVQATTDSSKGQPGNFDIYPPQQPVTPLTPGMKITASDQRYTKTLVIVPLTIDTLDQSSSTASGTAPQGASVQVCANNNTTATFLGCVTTSASGDTGAWSVTFAPGTLALGVDVSAQVFDADGDRSGTHKTIGPVANLDTTPPNPDTSDGSTFAFSSPTPGATFQCRVDGGPYLPCASPKTVYVANGSHTFDVEAGTNGTFGDPATFAWTANVAPPANDTLRVDVDGSGSFDSLDTANAYTTSSWQVLYATTLKLVNYADQPDTAGSAQLVPDAATDLGTVSPDGLTYTFTVRSGLKFSDGSDVTPQSFKAAIERDQDPATGSSGASFYQDVSSIGITDTTIAFHLSKPDGDFVQRLAMPFAAAVPPTTPHAAVSFEPGAGPYYIASSTADRVVLEQNPFYTGSRPSNFTRIVLDLGVDQTTAQARVEAGTSDYVMGTVDPSQVPASQQSQLFLNAQGTRWVGMNTTRAPFDNPNLRLAVSYALDRNAIVNAAGCACSPTDHYLVPGSPGYKPTSFIPLGGDLAKAQSLAAQAGVSISTPITANYYTCASTLCSTLASVIKDELAQIGINLNVVATGQLYNKLSTPGEPYDLFLSGWIPDYGDPADTFDQVFEGSGGANYSHYSGADAQIQADDALPPSTRYDAWASLEQSLATGDSPYAAIYSIDATDLFSERMSCQSFDPFYGMDLANLCTKATGSISLATTNGTSFPAGAATVDTASIPQSDLSGTQTSSTQVAPLDTIPLDTIPLDTIPLDTIPLDTIGINAALLKASSLGTIPLDTIPLSGGKTWTDLLAKTVLAGDPTTSLSLLDVANSAPTVLDALHLSDLANSPLDTIPLAAVTLTTVPLDTIPIGSDPAGSAANETDWCNLVHAIPGFSSFDCAAIGSQTVLGLAIRGVPLDTIPLDTIPLDTIDLRGTPLDTIPLDTIPLDTIHNSPLDTIPLDTIDFSLSPLDTIPLDTIPLDTIGNIVDCTMITCDDAHTLGQAKAAGALKPGATFGQLEHYTGVTAGNVGRGMPPNVTLHDLLALFLGQHSYDWEQLPLTFPLQDYATGGGVINYDAAFTLSSNGSKAGATVSVQLHDGERYVAGSSGGATSSDPKVTTASGGATPSGPQATTTSGGATSGGPNVTTASGDETLTWTLKGVATNTPQHITFRASTGLSLGSASAGASIVTSGNPAVASTPVSVTVGDTLEPNDPATGGTPAPLQAGDLAVSYLTSATDRDYFTLPVPELGTETKIILSHLPADYDLIVYGPQQQALRAAPLDTIPLDTIPVGDSAPTLQQQTQPLSPESLQDVPITPPSGQSLLGVSDARGTANEEVDLVSTGGGGTYTIEVVGYNGAFSDQPYVLRAATESPQRLPACTPRTMQGGGTAGTMPTIASNVDTLFLIDEKQFGDLNGAAAETQVVNALNSLDNTAGVGFVGAVVPVESMSGVPTAYGAWNTNPCDPTLANNVARAIIAGLDGIRATHTGIKNVVIVGGDDEIPMVRLADPTPLSNEANYAATFGFSSNNEFVSSFANHFLMSDDAYGDVQGTTYPGGQLYVPDEALGRLVDTPAEITAQLNQFAAVKGQLDPTTELTTGYSFLFDGATQEAAALKAPGRTAPQGDLLSDPTAALSAQWTADQLKSAMFPASGAAPSIMALNAHYNQSALLPADQSAKGTQDALYTAAMLKAQGAGAVANRLVLTLGCHSGVNAPDSLFSGAAALDWAQAYAAGGAIDYIGNTGYGLGDDVTVAYSEQLHVDLAKRLDGSLSVGQALTYAKQDYIGGLGQVSAYDAKVINEATLYGLPMWRIGNAAPPTAPLPGPTFTDPSTGGPAQSVSVSPSFTQHTTPYGAYYSVGSETVSAESRRPIEPTTSVDVTEPNLNAHGFLITSLALDSSSDQSINAAFSRPVFDDPAAEPELVGLVNYPTKLQSIRAIQTPTGQQQHLVLTVGQFFSSGVSLQGLGTQRLFSNVGGRVLYSGTSVQDWTPPSLGPVTVDRASGNVAFTMPASDSSGVVRVLVLYLDGTTWRSLDLSNNGNGIWSGAGPIGDETGVSYFAQAVDAKGNVGVVSDKGSLAPVVAPVHTGGVSYTVSGPSTNGWFTGAATVAFTHDAGVTVQSSLDGSAFADVVNDSVPVDGTGTHTLSYTASDGSSGTVVIPIDETAPTISIGSNMFPLNSTKPFNAVCSDAGSGIASCVTTPAQPDTSTAGVKSFTVTATDRVGKTATASGSYQVWAFTGFQSPIASQPTVNIAKAGQAVPMKFGLGFSAGLSIFAPTFPVSTLVDCNTGAQTTTVSTVSAGTSSLSYDATSNTYSYIWKTDSSWAGTCRQLDVRLLDGTDHKANFQFK